MTKALPRVLFFQAEHCRFLQLLLIGLCSRFPSPAPHIALPAGPCYRVGLSASVSGALVGAEILPQSLHNSGRMGQAVTLNFGYSSSCFNLKLLIFTFKFLQFYYTNYNSAVKRVRLNWPPDFDGVSRSPTFSFDFFLVHLPRVPALPMFQHICVINGVSCVKWLC